MHKANIESRKGNLYIPKSMAQNIGAEKINRGRHALEIRMNGT